MLPHIMVVRSEVNDKCCQFLPALLIKLAWCKAILVASVRYSNKFVNGN